MTVVDQQVGQAFEFRVRGRVQGVGFRPTVWRLANQLGLTGEVLNDGEGVLLRLASDPIAIDALIERLRLDPPPLARIDTIERRPYLGALPDSFRIAESGGGRTHTQIAPDAAVCPQCLAEIDDAADRRHRYAFTNCTHCGPRLTIVTDIPYDRAATSMSAFPVCKGCAREYSDPANRRFHAEPIACPICGPQLALIALGGAPLPTSMGDDIAGAAGLIRAGCIVAIKGLGGYQLACDATDADAVAFLRRRKRRDSKPFALMARDLRVIRRYCEFSAGEERALTSAAAPIVLLPMSGCEHLPAAIAPGLMTLGFMLPTTPLHHLLLKGFDSPLVMTSGNLSEEPQVTADDEALQRLRGIADYALVHDRAIANRVDDSVVRVIADRSRVLRRARGFAPAPLRLPVGFEEAPDLVAMGADLKSAFCIVKDGEAILSQHLGDLEDVATYDDYGKTVALYQRLFDHQPRAFVVDLHPGYLSSSLGRRKATEANVPLIEVQHHHAHVAACLAENGWRLDAAPVLGVVLDGLGFGIDGTIWGGEFLLADYAEYRRLARLRPVPMLGGDRAAREPWRNLYAHLGTTVGWDKIGAHAGLPIYADLERRPRKLLDRMMAGKINAPPTSSCGRLFDAVAAALDICRERQTYEGEAAACLESLAEEGTGEIHEEAYPFALVARGELHELDPAPMWRALLRDLGDRVPASAIAARFHWGLASALAETAVVLAETGRFDTVALSGGCFHNRILLEATTALLRERGFAVLTHAQVPAGDGGLALGQAAIGAASRITRRLDS